MESTAIPISQSNNDSSIRIQDVFLAQKNNLPFIRKQTVKTRIKKLKELKKAIFNHRNSLQKAVYSDFKKAPIVASVLSKIMGSMKRF
jgi:hypothetical protein